MYRCGFFVCVLGLGFCDFMACGPARPYAGPQLGTSVEKAPGSGPGSGKTADPSRVEVKPSLVEALGLKVICKSPEEILDSVAPSSQEMLISENQVVFKEPLVLNDFRERFLIWSGTSVPSPILQVSYTHSVLDGNNRVTEDVEPRAASFDHLQQVGFIALSQLLMKSEVDTQVLKIDFIFTDGSKQRIEMRFKVYLKKGKEGA